MPELVQESLHLTQCQQGRFFIRRLGEVHHQRRVRTHVVALAVYPLTLKFGHPGTALLALAREEVGIQHGQIRAVAVRNLVGFHVGVIHRDVFVLLEGDAVQAGSQSEDALDDVLQLEVRAQHLCVEVVFLHL